MLKTLQGVKLQEWFGDFGGRFCVNDTALLRYGKPELEYEKVLPGNEYEEIFREVLKKTLPSYPTACVYQMYSERKLITLPEYGKYYNLAGHIALALAMEKKDVYTGVYDRNLALKMGELCREYGLMLHIILGQELSMDTQVRETLEQDGFDVNATVCQELFDLPFAYIEVPFKDPLPGLVIQPTANYGGAPGPALTGALAGLYGEDISNMKETADIDTIVVPITDGTEALAVFKAYLDTDVKLFTVEDVVAQEYHLIDHNCYSLSTRSADREQMNTTLCPELVNLWRTGRVTRLGCDRIRPLDTTEVDALKTSYRTKRAAVLALELADSKNILVMEDER